MNKPASSTINIQDPFFYQLRKESRTVHVYLVSGKRLTGVIRRFDRYSIILENNGHEQLVYKHAMASIAPTSGAFPSKPQEEPRD
ncbi:MAG: RNA chaperone Hfq [Thermoanaerobaculales bacterium]